MDPRWRTFRYAAFVYAFGSLIHTVDHFRRGVSATTDQVVMLGTFGLVAAGVALTLAFTRHRLAPLFAVVIALPHGMGIAAVHYLPAWSAALSDAFPGHHVSPLSWIAVTVEVAGALAFAVTGAMLLRDERAPRLAH